MEQDLLHSLEDLPEEVRKQIEGINKMIGMELKKMIGRAEKESKRVENPILIPHSEWEWYGKSAHFIMGNDCRFHLATKVGEYMISTIGEYLPDAPIREILAKSRGIKLQGKGDARLADYMKKIGYEEIGYKRKYETMIFRCAGLCQCGCGQPTIDPEDLWFDCYDNPGESRDGHMKLCTKIAQGWEPEKEGVQ